jgi:phosphopantothenoylcysteine decarboxylase/phosphopantothenate--cysteine ligase
MNIVIAVTGGIAAYKSCDLINVLKKEGHNVRCIMTENAKQFITPLTLASLSGHAVMDNMWAERDDIGHIEVAKWANIFIVYPATANIIAKFSNGIADDLLSTVFLALPWTVKKIICPAMNTCMWENKATQRNVNVLVKDDCFILGPVDGKLACGDVGKGKIVSVKDVVSMVQYLTSGMALKVVIDDLAMNGSTKL